MPLKAILHRAYGKSPYAMYAGSHLSACQLSLEAAAQSLIYLCPVVDPALY